MSATGGEVVSLRIPMRVWHIADATLDNEVSNQRHDDAGRSDTAQEIRSTAADQISPDAWNAGGDAEVTVQLTKDAWSRLIDLLRASHASYTDLAKMIDRPDIAESRDMCGAALSYIEGELRQP